MTVYGDISPRTAGFVSMDLLERARPFMCMGLFGQQKPIPKNKTQSVIFRRYNSLAPSTVPMVEGITPAPDNITHTDVPAMLRQYGRRAQITDVIQDTHEDPVLKEYTEIMGELVGQTQELVIYNVLKSGTNVLFAGGTSRATVSAPVGTGVLNRAIRSMKRQNAKMITKMLGASDKVGTSSIRAGYIAFCHTDVQTDLEGLPGWKDKSDYGTYSVVNDAEFGSYKELRFLGSTLYEPFRAAGAPSATLLSNGVAPTVPSPCDVYPIVIVGADSYATVSLAGTNAVSPIVLTPKPAPGDELGQRGSVGWKTWLTALVLNDAWMLRCEVGVNA